MTAYWIIGNLILICMLIAAANIIMGTILLGENGEILGIISLLSGMTAGILIPVVGLADIYLSVYPD